MKGHCTLWGELWAAPLLLSQRGAALPPALRCSQCPVAAVSQSPDLNSNGRGKSCLAAPRCSPSSVPEQPAALSCSSKFLFRSHSQPPHPCFTASLRGWKIKDTFNSVSLFS